MTLIIRRKYGEKYDKIVVDNLRCNGIMGFEIVGEARVGVSGGERAVHGQQ